MSAPTLRHPIAAWGFVVGLVRSVTQPPADTARCDARVEAVAAESRLVGMLSAAMDGFRRAIDSSAVVAACRRTVRRLVPALLSERVRAIGVVAGVAAVTTLALRAAATEREPLIWVLPSAVAVVAVFCVVAAGAIARAIARYRA